LRLTFFAKYDTINHPADIDENSLLQAIDTAVTMNENGDYGMAVPDYTDENVSGKVVKIIQSYTSVVDKMVWRKN
jgi:UDP-N-acetylglucosamine 2-epimerase (non-hydrolysing)